MATRSALPAVVCAENIAVLSVLHTVPQPPSANVMNPGLVAKATASGRALSLDEERCLVGALSFLAGVSVTDHSKVAAVCLHEVGGTTAGTLGLRLVIAANKAGAGDNAVFMNTLKRSFEHVLQPLARIQSGDDAPTRLAVEESVFAAIIAMCNTRIQHRLRLVSSGPKKKQPFHNILEQANNSLKKNPKRRKKYGALSGRISHVMKLFAGLTGHQVEAQVRQLVESVYQLCRETTFCSAVADICNEDMPRENRICLINIVTKVARYREVARFLCRMAGQDGRSLVRRWTVVPAMLPASAFDRPDLPDLPGRSDLTAVMAQACGKQAAAWTPGELQYMFKHLGTTPTKASAVYDAQVRSALAESKVHAEMQLLAYCELLRCTHAVAVPRVIRSHKAACFLCNLFLTQACIQTAYFTSQSHGRLYPAWRLPQCLGGTVCHDFNELLARQIKESIHTLQTRRAKTYYPYPAESELTALGSLASVGGVVGNVPAHCDDDDDDAEQPPTEQIAETAADGVELEAAPQEKPLEAAAAIPIEPAPSETPEQAAPAEEPPVGNSPAPERTASVPAETVIVRAVSPEDGTTPLLTVDDGSTSGICQIGRLALQVEYDRQNKRAQLQFTVELLARDMAASLGTDLTVDVGRLAPGEEAGRLSLDSRGCLHLSWDGDVYRVTVVFIP